MTDEAFDPGPLAQVARQTSNDRAVLVFVRELRHSPQKVWAALTDPAQLRQWAPFTASRNLGKVGDATLTMTDTHAMASHANVTRAQPPVLLEYTWGDDILRWELEATEQGTKLTLHHSTQDPSMVPKAAAGWHICLVVAERLLDGDPIAPIVGEDAMRYGWQALHDAYADRL